MQQEELFHFLGSGGQFSRRKKRARAQAETESGAVDFFAQKTEPKQPQAVDEDEPIELVDIPPLKDAAEVAEWRKAYSVKVDGDDLAGVQPIVSFRAFDHHYHANLLAAGWAAPTLVQSEAIPVLLARRDLICCAPTGSGKTAAYMLPMLSMFGGQHLPHAPRGLVVAPTRELAEQVHRVAEQLAAGSAIRVGLVCSERSVKPGRWRRNGEWDVIVATPLRLLQLVDGGLLSLDTIEYLVVDEADRLLEGDFVDQADRVFGGCSHPRLVRAVFSATMGDRPERLARAVMFSPVRIIIGGRVATLSDDMIHQQLVYVGSEAGKLLHFRQLLEGGLEPPVLIFVGNRARAAELTQTLSLERINVDLLTSDRTELQRQITVKQFRQGIVWVLVTTDVLGRGVDFRGVNVVINWDMPRSVPDYVHRVGRTGRAGRPGRAISYFADADIMIAKSVSHIMRNAGGNAPDWLLNTPKKELAQREWKKTEKLKKNHKKAAVMKQRK